MDTLAFRLSFAEHAFMASASCQSVLLYIAHGFGNAKFPFVVIAAPLNLQLAHVEKGAATVFAQLLSVHEVRLPEADLILSG